MQVLKLVSEPAVFSMHIDRPRCGFYTRETIFFLNQITERNYDIINRVRTHNVQNGTMDNMGPWTI